MSRPVHSKKEIEEALRYAEAKGWRVEKSGPRAHAWGRLFCGEGHRMHQMSIWGTPKSAEHHARRIKRFVDQCVDEVDEVEEES